MAFCTLSVFRSSPRERMATGSPHSKGTSPPAQYATLGVSGVVRNMPGPQYPCASSSLSLILSLLPCEGDTPHRFRDCFPRDPTLFFLPFCQFSALQGIYFVMISGMASALPSYWNSVLISRQSWGSVLSSCWSFTCSISLQ